MGVPHKKKYYCFFYFLALMLLQQKRTHYLLTWLTQHKECYVPLSNKLCFFKQKSPAFFLSCSKGMYMLLIDKACFLQTSVCLLLGIRSSWKRLHEPPLFQGLPHWSMLTSNSQVRIKCLINWMKVTFKSQFSLGRTRNFCFFELPALLWGTC